MNSKLQDIREQINKKLSREEKENTQLMRLLDIVELAKVPEPDKVHIYDAYVGAVLPYNNKNVEEMFELLEALPPEPLFKMKDWLSFIPKGVSEKPVSHQVLPLWFRAEPPYKDLYGTQSTQKMSWFTTLNAGTQQMFRVEVEFKKPPMKFTISDLREGKRLVGKRCDLTSDELVPDVLHRGFREGLTKPQDITVSWRRVPDGMENVIKVIKEEITPYKEGDN